MQHIQTPNTITFHQVVINNSWEKRLTSFLKENDLPTADLATSKPTFIVAMIKERLIGSIAVEHFKKEGLLRSLAVDTQYRNKGLGNQLFQKLLTFSAQLGIENLHLLTTTAEKYFLSKGFVLTNREEAPKAIKNTEEFSAICPASSAYMTLKQIDKKQIT